MMLYLQILKANFICFWKENNFQDEMKRNGNKLRPYRNITAE